MTDCYAQGVLKAAAKTMSLATCGTCGSGNIQVTLLTDDKGRELVTTQCGCGQKGLCFEVNKGCFYDEVNKMANPR